MSKQLIHPYIDSEDYLILKNKNINISELCRNLIKQYLAIESAYIGDEIKLLDELEQNKKIIEKANLKVGELSTKIMVIKENNKKEFQEKLDVERRINQGVKDSGINPLNR